MCVFLVNKNNPPNLCQLNDLLVQILNLAHEFVTHEFERQVPK